MSGELTAKIEHDNINHKIALTCAPLLAGIKISNLYLAEKQELVHITKELEGTRLSVTLLSENSRRIALLLYDTSKMREHLKRKDVKAFLKRMGYKRTDISSVLKRLSDRYRRYSASKKHFPHELGVLLGYPVGDVDGFMKNEGRNYIFSGYWKVYTDPERTSKTFKKYDIATEFFLRHAVNGKTLRDIIDL